VIAVDTSSLSAYLAGRRGTDVDLVEDSLAQRHAVLPPVVLCELLSTPRLVPALAALFRALPVLAVVEGYWERAGLLRAKLLARRFKARLADALIAQSCIDHGVALITADADFRHFETLGGLKRVP
jgi:predicted nucleic acid-binding protein